MYRPNSCIAVWKKKKNKKKKQRKFAEMAMVGEPRVVQMARLISWDAWQQQQQMQPPYLSSLFLFLILILTLFVTLPFA